VTKFPNFSAMTITMMMMFRAFAVKTDVQSLSKSGSSAPDVKSSRAVADSDDDEAVRVCSQGVQ